MNILNRLKELDDGDEEEPFYIDMIRVFMSQSAGIIDKLKLSIDNKSCDDIKAIAHELKGISANLGCTRLAKICQNIEDLSKLKDENHLGIEYNKLYNVYSGSLKELKLIISDFE